MHRTFQDIQASWGDIILNNLYAQVGLGKYGAPGSWNDPDFLEVCNGNLTRMQVGGATREIEQRVRERERRGGGGGGPPPT
jgi:hypothetical protein